MFSVSLAYTKQTQITQCYLYLQTAVHHPSLNGVEGCCEYIMVLKLMYSSCCLLQK